MKQLLQGSPCDATWVDSGRLFDGRGPVDAPIFVEDRVQV